jgi:transposase
MNLSVATVRITLFSILRRGCDFITFPRRKQPVELAADMNNLRRHNGQKVIDKMKRNHMMRLDHPPYSPDSSPCDFWLFVVLKNRMKENGLRNADEVDDSVCNFWSAMTLKDVQLVFRE